LSFFDKFSKKDKLKKGLWMKDGNGKKEMENFFFQVSHTENETWKKEEIYS